MLIQWNAILRNAIVIVMNFGINLNWLRWRPNGSESVPGRNPIHHHTASFSTWSLDVVRDAEPTRSRRRTWNNCRRLPDLPAQFVPAAGCWSPSCIHRIGSNYLHKGKRYILESDGDEYFRPKSQRRRKEGVSCKTWNDAMKECCASEGYAKNSFLSDSGSQRSWMRDAIFTQMEMERLPSVSRPKDCANSSEPAIH